MNINFYLILLLIIYFTLITLYFYIRISYSSFILNYNEINWFIKNNFNKKNFLITTFFLFINIFGLIFINFIFILL